MMDFASMASILGMAGGMGQAGALGAGTTGALGSGMTGLGLDDLMLNPGLGKVPGMGGADLGNGMAGIPGMEGTNKIPGQGNADQTAGFMAENSNKTGPMAMMLGMQALKSLSEPPAQNAGRAPSAGMANLGGKQIATGGTKQYATPGSRDKAAVAKGGQ